MIGAEARRVSIHIFVADDHGVLRGSLRTFLDAQPDMEVIGEAESGSSAVAGILKTEPDVVLMDLSMPDGGGLEAIAAVKRVRPKTRFLVLTAQDEPGYVRAAANAGALGFIVKMAAHTELLSAIRAVAQGRTFVDTSTPAASSYHPADSLAPHRDGRAIANELTAREREVLCRVAEGYTNGQIAGQLKIGLKSVETYRARVMAKLGVDDRAALVRFALESGVLAAGKPKR